ncbi:MAG: hypothetical protein QXT63_05280 [Thermoplasmata archaeon]
MKCYFHEEKEAIGVCVSCGKGLCDDCKIEFDGKLHCKACVEKKSISQKRHESFYPQYSRPYMYPFYQNSIWNLSYKPPMPIRKPTKLYFYIGAIGSIIFAIVCGFSAFIFGEYVFNGYQLYRNFPLGLALGTLISISVTSLGFYGYYRNYGRFSGLACCIFMMITGMLYAISSLGYAIFNNFDVYYTIIPFILLGIASGVMAWANLDSKDMFDLKPLIFITAMLLGMCAVSSLTIIPMFFGCGWFPFTVALSFQAFLFSRAKIFPSSGQSYEKGKT